MCIVFTSGGMVTSLKEYIEQEENKNKMQGARSKRQFPAVRFIFFNPDILFINIIFF